MELYAVLGAQTLYLGDDYTFESAYEYILEQDSDGTWLEGFDLILDDVGIRWRLEADCWVEIDEESDEEPRS